MPWPKLRRAQIPSLVVLAVTPGRLYVQREPETPKSRPRGWGDGIQVAASVAPHAWLISRIAGDDFRVVTVLPGTADPHSHTPTDSEVSRLARAQVLFRAGVPFENGSWLSALAARGIQLVDLRQGIEMLEDGHGHGHAHRHDHEAESSDHEVASVFAGDPHTWTSPRRLAAQAPLVAATLADLRPERSPPIHRRAQALAHELKQLDSELRHLLAAYAGREFFVHHPSWSYFAADYGLVQVALEAGGSEPTDAQLTGWLRRAREAEAAVVFTQPQSADRTPRIVSDTLSARLEVLNPLAPDVPHELRVTAEWLLASWNQL